MKKLFKLRDWMTVPETARYLSLMLEESFLESDVLRLVLDQQLILSVDFVNHAFATVGRIITSKELEERNIPSEFTEMYGDDNDDKLIDKFAEYARYLESSDDFYYIFTDKKTTMSGVWDLPLIGSEKLDIEHAYQQLTGGPSVTLVNIDGAFVTSKDRRIFRLLESYDENEFHPGSKAQLNALRLDISGSNDDDLKRYEQYKQDREDYLQARKSQDLMDDYYPAGTLPSDSVLVVRTSYLQDFIKSLDGEAENKHPSELPETERNSLLKLVLGIVVTKYRYQPGTRRSVVTGENRGSVVADLQKCGIQLDVDTVRKFVKEADEKFGAEITKME